jgi:hypothetical protein
LAAKQKRGLMSWPSVQRGAKQVLVVAASGRVVVVVVIVIVHSPMTTGGRSALSQQTARARVATSSDLQQPRPV